jgi:hypothetical protein
VFLSVPIKLRIGQPEPEPAKQVVWSSEQAHAFLREL